MVVHELDDAPAIVVRGLAMRYGSKDVLDGAHFTVGRGEVVTLLGPWRSGAMRPCSGAADESIGT